MRRAGHKIGSTSGGDPTAREMVGFLRVLAVAHRAYARALEILTGADLKKLSRSRTSEQEVPEAKKWEDKGLHRIMFQWSPTTTSGVGESGGGPHPETAPSCSSDHTIPEASRPRTSRREPQLTAPASTWSWFQENR